ncbi:hypothetical protein HGRIS_001328 [Hohenbuehelia grisea]|uniref:Uncharacterized protein n=1 Tax=Hohenbuehelia grisea TaxID=104357 RepID=A0ABR3JNZ1_9AGAR
MTGRNSSKRKAAAPAGEYPASPYKRSRKPSARAIEAANAQACSDTESGVNKAGYAIDAYMREPESPTPIPPVVEKPKCLSARMTSGGRKPAKTISRSKKAGAAKAANDSDSDVVILAAPITPVKKTISACEENHL